MRKYLMIFLVVTSFLLDANIILADNYPDQHHVFQIEDLSKRIESQSGIRLSEDGTCFMLVDSAIYGYLILKPDTAEYPFNHGLPSWNGTALDENCGFSSADALPGR